MGPDWRRRLKLWWVRLAMICFVYLCLAAFFEPSAPRIEALWPWAWPWSGYMFLGSLLLALVILPCIGVYVVVSRIADPFLTAFVEKELHKRTAKAKEKYADGLMSFSTALCSATFIAVLLFPLTAFIQFITTVTNPVVQLPWVLRISGFWEALLFYVVLLTLFCLPVGVATWFRRRALGIYDEISPPAPAEAPTAQGTTKPSTIPDPGPPVYVKVNGESRRRRRHRGT